MAWFGVVSIRRGFDGPGGMRRWRRWWHQPQSIGGPVDLDAHLHRRPFLHRRLLLHRRLHQRLPRPVVRPRLRHPRPCRPRPPCSAIASCSPPMRSSTRGSTTFRVSRRMRKATTGSTSPAATCSSGPIGARTRTRPTTARTGARPTTSWMALPPPPNGPLSPTTFPPATSEATPKRVTVPCPMGNGGFGITRNCSTVPAGQRRFPFPVASKLLSEDGLCNDPNTCGDKHVLVVEKGACRLWESYFAYNHFGPVALRPHRRLGPEIAGAAAQRRALGRCRRLADHAAAGQGGRGFVG